MPRPKGSPNRLKPGDPNYKKPGRKSGATSLPQHTDEQVLDYKYQILKLMSEGKAKTLSEACRLIGVDPVRVYAWGNTDRDFQQMVRLTREVIADDIEASFTTHANFIPQMMLLKSYRPMFRDTYKFDIRNERLEKLLGELRELKELPSQPEILLPSEGGGVEENGNTKEISSRVLFNK